MHGAGPRLRRSAGRTAIYLRVLLVSLSLGAIASAQNWPSFRGEHASGLGSGKVTPTKWNGVTSNKVTWKTPIPGLSHSSPIVWGDVVFVTTAVRVDGAATFQAETDDIAPVPENTSYRWLLYCLDKRTGRVIWERTAHEGVPRVKRHLKASQANATPATDGNYVVALFGSEGLFCFDLKGQLVWKQDLGILDPGLHDDASYQWGHASSPVIYKQLVIVLGDGHAQSFLAAFHLANGKPAWRVTRGELPSWSSPTVYEGKTRVELITSAPRFIRGYDPLTGKELWRLANNDLVVQVPTPLVANDLFVVTGGWPGGRPITAVRPGATGDLSASEAHGPKTHLVWRVERGGPYVPNTYRLRRFSIRL